MLKLGMLSNLTKAKGVFNAIDTYNYVLQKGIDAQLELVGPVDPTIKDNLGYKTATLQNAHIIGPKYGKDKWDWLESIDFFLFPTNYYNEAYPLVILEALKCKVPVISTPKGCIECMLPKRWIFEYENYELLAGEFILSNLENINLLKEQAYEEFSKLIVKDKRELDTFITSMYNAL